MVSDVETDFMERKADIKMKKVWGWRWSLRGLMWLWVCVGWAVFLDIFLGFPVITFLMILLSILLLIICHKWASLYWKNYSFELRDDRIIVKRGIIGKRKVTIPYDRIQNVNVVQGILERYFVVSNIQIETAGGSSYRGGGGYGVTGASEGTIQGLSDPKPIESEILLKVKASKTGAGPGAVHDMTESNTTSSDIRMRLKVLEIECAECGRDFLMNDRKRPFDVFCPHCGVKGVIE